MSDQSTFDISTWDASEVKKPETKPAQADEKPMLRRPFKPGEQPRKTLTGSWPVSTPKVNSVLNPNAKVFSPLRAVYTPQQITGTEDPSLIHVPSMGPIQSMPQSAALAPSVVPVPSECYEYEAGGSIQDYALPANTDGRKVDVLSNVKDVLNLMSVNPGCFDEYIDQLVHALNTDPLDKNQLDSLTEFIYEQAVFDTNFTYTAAKVCNCLCKDLAVQPGIDTFRNTLMSKLQKEFKEREACLNDPAFIERLHRFTMFIAELFLNMEVMINNKPSKADILRKALGGIMESLLKYLNDENALMLIKLLKLTGAEVEDFDRDTSNKSSTNLQSIFSTIRNVILDNKLSRNTRQMLLDLVELRASNWGRDTSSPTAQQLYSSTGSGDSAVGVTDLNTFTFYSPDGRVITEEEASKYYVNENDFNNIDEYFNKWSLGTNEKSNNIQHAESFHGSDTNFYDQGPDMFNDEVAEAFDEYMRITNTR